MKRNQVVLLLLTGGIFLGSAVSEKVYAEPELVVDPARIIGHRIPVELDMSASANLKRHVDWMAQPSSTIRYLEFTGSYTQSRNNLVGYVKGTLRLKNGMLHGEGTQYFNDRTYNMPSIAGPFNPKATDRLGLSIDPATGKAKIILLSWGGGTTEMQLEYKNGIFYGFPQKEGMHAFVFKRLEGPK